jgi:molecular chaperone HtpG
MSEVVKEKMEFKTELRQLLHLITHSLYSNKEIFLRELISNASDAINKVRFDSVDREETLEENRDWAIRIQPNKEAKTLTISDNGVGMNRDTIIENLGTIARSGTKRFLESLKEQNAAQKPELIGQFGVGFYSAYMVADKVTVLSRTSGKPEDGVLWESDGQGEFTLETATKATRGTEVTLHLKEDSVEYLESWKLQQLVKKFSDFIEHPIILIMTKTEDGKDSVSEETVNTRKAIWLRSKSEITTEEYTEFYHQISGENDSPLRTIHYLAEGQQEFRVLAFIPTKKPFMYDYEEPKGVKLYIQRVLITDSCDELLPTYLRFVRGVVDSTDLPLNVSREILQHNPLLEKIRKNLIRNIFEGLEAIRNLEPEKYKEFFEEFGTFLKIGTAQDWENKERLADLLLLESINTPVGSKITLSDYIAKMKEDQKEIHFLCGESRSQVESSPLMESYRAKGEDVLIVYDPQGEYAINSIGTFKEKKLNSISTAEYKPSEEKHPEQESFEKLLEALKLAIPEVKEIRLSDRLTESASCLSTLGRSYSAQMEKIMERMGQSAPQPTRILELNPKHPLVVRLQTEVNANAESESVKNIGRLLYEQAVLSEGGRLPDLGGFIRRINDLAGKSFGS